MQIKKSGAVNFINTYQCNMIRTDAKFKTNKSFHLQLAARTHDVLEVGNS